MKKQIESIKKYKRLADYLGAVQIYLKDNFFLERKLEKKDIKDRLLGHWGTVPGLNFTYACLNNLICKTGQEMIFITGTGHGFPATQANLFLEGTLTEYYKEIPYNRDGVQDFCTRFSWPYGYPSHLNPGAPGCIVEGGELGYSLGTAFGAVMDNPDLIVACTIGDGEAETASINAAYHSVKFLNPIRDGAVLPIIQLNGFKISGPTVLSMMNERDLKSYYSGLGYKAFIVKGSGDKIYESMVSALDESYKIIKEIQTKARKENKVDPTIKYPIIILKYPKGWGCTKEFKGTKLEGNTGSHQVILENCKTDEEQLKAVEKWFKSYKIEELVDKNFKPNKEIVEIIPKKEKRMGMNKNALGGKVRKDLKMPKLEDLELKFSEKEIFDKKSSSMKKAGEFMRDIFKLNSKEANFRIFSPDETYSNKIEAVFEETDRVYLKKPEKFLKDLSPDGRVMEMLSENTLQGWMQGYVLTGRHGVFVTYEAFAHIVSAMLDQYIKFIHHSKYFPWRKGVPSINYILSSLIWRQDHNGFSHQNPSFTSSALEKHGDFVSVYYPVDTNSTLASLEEMYSLKDSVNIMIAGKRENPQYFTLSEAKKSLKKGGAILEKFSDKNPDLVLATAGDYITQETIFGLKSLKKHFPELKIQVSVIQRITKDGFTTDKKETSKLVEEFFTKDKPVVFNYHGYPSDIKKIFFDYIDAKRFDIKGYDEEGSTTTPLDMMIRNNLSRYNMVLRSIEMLRGKKVIDDKKLDEVKKIFEKKLKDHREFIIKEGIDPKWINEV